jgi:hypothetical protein
MHNAGHSQRSADDGKGIVAIAHRQMSPKFEVIGLAPFVQRERHAAVQQDDGAPYRCHLDGN